MKINSIGALNTVNTTNFGNKEKCCTPCCNSDNNSTVTVPRHSYNKMMGLAALAMAIGGPLLTSCDPDDDFPDKPDIHDVTDTITVEVAKQTEAQANMTNMAGILGIMSMQKSAVVDTCFVKKGDIVEMGWTNGFYKEDTKLKINDDLCTNKKMVYDGKNIANETGNTSYARYTFTSDGDDGVNEKIEMTADKKPITKNSEFINTGNYNYVPVEGGVAKYKILSDGSERYEGKYTPNSPSSLTYTTSNGASHDLTGISVVQK